MPRTVRFVGTEHTTFIPYRNLGNNCCGLEFLSKRTGNPKDPPPPTNNPVASRAVGSYLSGRPDSSDIDILVSPPPAALEAAAGGGRAAALEPHPLLQALLEELLGTGYLTDGVGFHGAGAVDGNGK